MSPAPPHPPNFDRIARPYRLLEYATFGAALHRARIHFLPRLSPFRRALILGDGDGRFTAALLAAHPHLHAVAVDISPAMLALLARRVVHAGAGARLTTRCADLRTLDPTTLPGSASGYDLIATHFFLDCLTEPELRSLVERLRPHLLPGAAWLLSDFSIPPSGPLRLPARALVRSLYAGFRLLTGLRTTALPDHAAALRAAGLSRSAHHRLLRGILTTELWRIPPRSLPQEPAPMMPSSASKTSHLHAASNDPVPNPEPASPSLPEPDPGVFHHEPTPPPPPVPSPS